MLNKKDLKFLKSAYGENKNQTGQLLIQHALDTAKNMATAAGRFREINDLLKRKMVLASAGHDLLEDTDTSGKEIEKIWGGNVLTLIKKLTNAKGDSDFDDYIKNLKKSPEEVLLIKFADIQSNAENSVKTFKKLDNKWIKEFWLPLLKNYKHNLFDVKFVKYPITSRYFIEVININIKKLQELSLK